MEIESINKEELDNIVIQLGLDNVPHNDVSDRSLYENTFGIIIPKTCLDLTFSNVHDTLGPLCTKNNEEFDNLIQLQQNLFNKIKSQIY
jgi:hypothetical protein